MRQQVHSADPDPGLGLDSRSSTCDMINAIDSIVCEVPDVDNATSLLDDTYSSLSDASDVIEFRSVALHTRDTKTTKPIKKKRRKQDYRGPRYASNPCSDDLIATLSCAIGDTTANGRTQPVAYLCWHALLLFVLCSLLL